MTRFRVVLLCLGLLCTAHFAGAQSQILRGRVVVAATDAPLIGALVQVQRMNGEVVTTTTTSESGNFATGLASGSYRVRILRVGFRPFMAGTITIASDAPAIMNVAWTAVPIPLATRLVQAERACKISADSGTLIANVWEETRKALLSSMIAEQSDAPELERANFERYVDTTGVIIKQDLSMVRSKSFRAYSSWAPESLSLHGYVSVQGNTFEIVGPDATTLISDAFAASHCFALTQDAKVHANDIGLAFTPISSKNKERVDIAGTFWVNRNTWALRSVDYNYEGGLFEKDSDIAGVRRAGGFVEFGSLASGQWLVTNWRIRRPILDPAVTFSLKQKVDVRIVGSAYVAGIDESGGFVTRIAQNGVTQLEKTLPTVSLKVISRDTAIKVEGTQIRIAGFDTLFTIDQTGTLRLPGFLEGKYAVSATVPSIASFAKFELNKQVSVHDVDVLDSIEVPTTETVVRTSCGPKADFTKNSAVLGTLTLKTQRVPGIYLVVEWPTVEINPKSGLAVLGRAVVTNADGRFLVCNVPRGPIVVRPSVDVSLKEQSMTLNPTDAVQRVEVDFAPKEHVESYLPAANVEIQLFDADNKPVATKFTVTNAAGKQISVSTDKFGRAVLDDQPSGPFTLTVNKQAPFKQNLVLGYNLVRVVVIKK